MASDEVLEKDLLKNVMEQSNTEGAKDKEVPKEEGKKTPSVKKKDDGKVKIKHTFLKDTDVVCLDSTLHFNEDGIAEVEDKKAFETLLSIEGFSKV